MSDNQLTSLVRRAFAALKEAWRWTLKHRVWSILIAAVPIGLAIWPIWLYYYRDTVPHIKTMGVRLEATPDANTYILIVYFKNDGKEEATAITAGTIARSKQPTKLLALPKKLSRLETERNESTSVHFNIDKRELGHFLVTCISYSGGFGARQPSIIFYSMPDDAPELNGRAVVPAPVGAEDEEDLGSGFSCAQLGR